MSGATSSMLYNGTLLEIEILRLKRQNKKKGYPKAGVTKGLVQRMLSISN